MATFELSGPDGAKYNVEAPDENSALQSFRKLTGTPEKAPDKYQQAAQEENASLKSKGIDTGAGYARRAIQGATFGGADEVLAGLSTPLEMIKRGTFDPREGYNYAKARENLIMDEARKNTGALGTAVELGGGVLSGTGLSNAGATLARPGMGWAGRTLAGAGEGAGYGAVSGALDGGDSFSDRFSGAGKGAMVGALTGGALPTLGAIGGAVAAPVVSNIRARVNPVGVAQSHFVRGLQESGQTPSQIERSIWQAAQEGQGGFTAADAMGNSGQRMLGTVTRSPGAGRQQAVDFLENRQGDQGRRISNALAEGFESPQTAAQTEARMTAARGAAADAEYGAVRSGSNPVDLVDPINHLDRIIGTQRGQVLTPANDSIEAVLTPFRQRLSRVNPDDFEAVQRIRGDMADAAEAARRGGQGNRARLIGGAVRQLDTAMESASSGYRQANQNFAQASRNIDAVDQGRTAAMRGRMEDTIPQFQGLPAEGQQAFRTGYVDPLIGSTQAAAFGANKARPLTNDAFQAEAGVMAPGNPLMQRRLGRENTMFETRRQATGGSQTHDNAQDAAAMHVDPSVLLSLAHGNVTGAAGHLLRSVTNGLTGYTPAVREQLAQLLLTRGHTAQISPIVDQVQNSLARRQALVRQLRSGLLAGTGEASQRK